MRLEERVYRMRCVEGWSMVIPWVGFPMAELLKRFEPQGSAKYAAFETLMRPSEMPAQRSSLSILPWPYVEGLRLDEALHPPETAHRTATHRCERVWRDRHRPDPHNPHLRRAGFSL